MNLVDETHRERSAAYSRNQKESLQYPIVEDTNPEFTHRRSWCGEHSQLISLHRRCSLTVAQGFLPWEPDRPGRPGTPKEFVKPSATPSELRIQLRIIPRVGNPGLGLGNTFGVKRGACRAVDCYQVICCSR